MDKFNLDDKDLVIVAALILGVVSMFVLKDVELIKQITTGLFGIAIGSRLK